MDPDMTPMTIEDKWGCAFVLLLTAGFWLVALAVVWKVIRWLV